jgi:hypothetical protein
MFKFGKIRLLILFSAFTLTGCLTSKLNDTAEGKVKFSYDTISGFTLAKNEKTKKELFSLVNIMTIL